MPLLFSRKKRSATTPQAPAVAIATGLDLYAPFTYATVSNGSVFAASGLSPMVKWNGQTPTFLQAGVPSPATPCALNYSGTGTITGAYSAYVRFVDTDGNPSSVSPISNTVIPTNAANIVYGNVPAATDPRVARRQILRNTTGQGITYYVDIDTTDLTGSNFTSPRTDTDLAAQEPVPLFDAEGNTLANRFDQPRNDKPIIVHYLGRLFAAGEVPYSLGHCWVQAGSTNVYGVATNWNSSMVGRFIYVRGSATAGEIAAVDTANQVLTLVDPWDGLTDKFSEYAIRQAPGERNLLYWSEANLPDAWPATAGVQIGDVGEPITALASAGSFLYVFQRRVAWRFSYQRDPARDAGVFEAFRRGLVNQRCWVQHGEQTYCLDEQGVYVFGSNEAVTDLSTPIQDLFWGPGNGSLRVAWEYSQYFHATHDQPKTTIRWFVALGHAKYPSHAICYHYVHQHWWIEEYPWPLGASTQAIVDRPMVAAAGPAARVYAFDGTLDGVSDTSGKLRGAVTTSTYLTISDSLTTFPATGLIGGTVAIVAGRGKGQLRRISAVSGATITVDLPWTIKPDTTSVYQLGAVRARWKSRRFRWTVTEKSTLRRMEVLFQPTTSDATLDVRLFPNFSPTPIAWGPSFPRHATDEAGLSWIKGEPDLSVHLAYEHGFVQARLDDSRDQFIARGDNFQLEMSGFSSRDVWRIFSLMLDGTPA